MNGIEDMSSIKGILKKRKQVIYEEEKLGAWVDTQKKRYKEGKISKERINKLLELDKHFFDSAIRKQ